MSAAEILRKNKLLYFLKPIYFTRRILHKIYELNHPDEPWLSQGAVNFCDRHLSEDQIGFEWGSGRSTAWFGKRLKSLLSIEHDPNWHATVLGMLRERNLDNVECRYIPLEHHLDEPTHTHYEKTPEYVKAIEEFNDETIDFVVVDGHYRQACIMSSLNKIKPGGLLLADNTNRLPLEEWGVPHNWPMVHQSHNVMTETTIWQKPKL